MGSPKDSERIPRKKLESKFCELSNQENLRYWIDTYRKQGSGSLADQGQPLMMTIRPT